MKHFILNRKGRKIAVVVNVSHHPNGLVFVMHGLSGFKEQEHIQLFAKSFRKNGFTIVLFDTTNTLGESEGKIEEATITNYFEDLEDVIAWAKKQKWYMEPFALAGHSLGGICSILYAEKHPEKVQALAPISTVVSGKLSVEAHKEFEPEDFENWQKTGWTESKSRSKPGIMKRFPWSHIEDRLKYDTLPLAHRLTMPVLLITGEKDTSTPPKHAQKLFDKLPGPKEFHVIKGSPHTFREKRHLEEVEKIFDNWIKKMEYRPK